MERTIPCPLTTHVLDTSRGQPAHGLSLALFRLSDGGGEVEVSKETCDINGRVGALIRDQSVWNTGTYKIRFYTGEYFVGKGDDYFYPFCDVTFIVKDAKAHYHVPLLISPFGYTTYRGS